MVRCILKVSPLRMGGNWHMPRLPTFRHGGRYLNLAQHKTSGAFVERVIDYM